MKNTNFLIASVLPVLRTINKNSPHQGKTSWYFRRLQQREGEGEGGKEGEREGRRGRERKRERKRSYKKIEMDFSIVTLEIEDK